MRVPLNYQVSEYDCAPATLLNAISYLFDRRDIPPIIVRHIYMYSLDTVGRGNKLGRAGTSRLALRLLAEFLSSYKTQHYSLKTEYLEGEEVTLNKITQCFDSGGVAMCNVLLSKAEEHFILAQYAKGDWIYCFDAYYRTRLQGLSKQVRVLQSEDGRQPNLAIQKDWFDSSTKKRRFCLGWRRQRECLLIWNDR